MFEQATIEKGQLRATTIGQHNIVVIDDRMLVAECLVKCLRVQRPSDNICSFSNAIDCIASIPADQEPTLLLISIGSKMPDDSRVASAFVNLRDAFPQTPIIVVADGEQAGQILEILDLGARGYIPTSLSLEVAIEAMILVGVGGTFIPATSLTSSRGSIKPAGASPLLDGTFTARQAAVVEALRKGKANKIIAYELQMRESTVKVHVRNIMKKLKAKNRTEVAYLANSQFE